MEAISLRRLFLVALFAAFGPTVSAQQSNQVVAPASIEGALSNVISFSDTMPGQPDGSINVTFALYPDQQSTSPTWAETQVVEVVQGKYTVVLGAASPNGILPEVFAADQAHWLGVQVNGTEKRYLLVSAPYAMKAFEADRLGGLLASQYVTQAQLQSYFLSSSSGPSSITSSGTKTSSPTTLAAASGTSPQPATDFTDNNTSEVLLVTQQGTGYAIHGISAGGPTIFAEAPQGVALLGAAEATDSSGTSLLLTNASLGKLISGGVGNGPILSSESFSVDASGNLFFAGAASVAYETSGTWSGNSLAKLTSTTGPLGSGSVTMTSAGDKAGVVGIFTGLSEGSKAQVAQAGMFACTFDAQAQVGNYVGISQQTAGACTDLGPTYPTNGNQVVGRVVTVYAPTLSLVLLFGPEQHGASANASLLPGDSSIVIGGTPAAPTIAVASGGITSDKLAAGAVTSTSLASGSVTNAQLAANSVTAANIADFSLPPTKISGTAATLGSNTFSGNQTMPGLTVSNSLFLQGLNNGFINLTNTTGTAFQVHAGSPTAGAVVASSDYDGIDARSNFTYAVFGSSTSATGVHGDGGTTGVEAVSSNVGLSATANNFNGGGIAGVFTNSGTGKILSGRSGSGSSEMFSVDGAGNLFYMLNSLSNGAASTLYPNGPAGTIPNGLVKLTPNGLAVSTIPGDTSGVIGIALSGAGATGNVQIAYSGRVICQFDNTFGPIAGDYAGISLSQAGSCRDLGQSVPAGSGQVVGRIISPPSGTVMQPRTGQVLLFGAEDRGGTLTTINTGQGLTGGPITSSGTISIASAGVTNSMLQNSAITLNLGAGLSGGGTAPLGGSVAISNTGALSFNGRTGNILSAPGDYSFSQLSGSASTSQLPATTVFNNQSNTFSTDQTINGALNATTANLQNVAVNTTSSQFIIAPLQVNDNGGAPSALYAFSQNNKAAAFQGTGPVILTANNLVEDVFTILKTGDVSALGQVTARAFSGDGSALSNVNASSVGGVSGANLATTSALNAETTARQSGDTTLQNNINSEAATRQSADASLASSLSAETATEQNDVSNLQASINSVSAADAKLAASNTFTTGTQDFSGAGATLPVRALPSAQTPASCVASKELLIKTDAAAGQQLFICDAGGATWNLVGDGASGGVTSFNGRNGSVSPSSGDYSFSQISGSLAGAQMPALSGDVVSAAGSTLTTLSASGVAAGTYTKVTVDGKGRATSGGQAAFSDLAGGLAVAQLPALTGDVSAAAGSNVTTLSSTGVTAGTYSKVTVDVKGRVSSGSQASFTDLAGSAAQNQLPASVVYNNQVNTFSAAQTVNGNLSATLFIGSGAGLNNVNAATLNSLPSSSFAQLATSNTFTGSLTATSFTGSGSGLTGVNAATVNNFQMLKFTATITPSSVGSQTCSEQSFTVSGVSSGDVLLAVHQPSTSSLGTNIAIGGLRVPGANTVAIQFCNVGKTSSTPASGTYTVAIMR